MTGFNRVTTDADLWFEQSEVLSARPADALCLFPLASGDSSLDLLSLSSQLGDTATSPANFFTSGVVETLPSLSTMNTVDEKRLEKLTRINTLLAEAAQLQSEVFC